MTQSWQGGEGPVTADKHVFWFDRRVYSEFFNFFDLKDHLGKKGKLNKGFAYFPGAVSHILRWGPLRKPSEEPLHWGPSWLTPWQAACGERQLSRLLHSTSRRLWSRLGC